jgi:hypothetical protein
MASIICRVSAQFTQNVFLRLDERQRGYLDQPILERALVGLGQQEVSQLLCILDQDGDGRISPYELNLAILDWLSEANTVPMPTAFTSLLVLYGMENEEPILKKTADVRPYTTSDHLYAQIGYAR